MFSERGKLLKASKYSKTSAPENKFQKKKIVSESDTNSSGNEFSDVEFDVNNPQEFYDDWLSGVPIDIEENLCFRDNGFVCFTEKNESS